MTIVIKPRPGERIQDVLHLLRDLADDPATVSTGGGGVVVNEELAYDYLTAILQRGPASTHGGQQAAGPAVSDLPPQAPAPPAKALKTSPGRRPPRKTTRQGG